MSTNRKISVFLIFALAFLFWRITTGLQQPQEGRVVFQGEVSSLPKVTKNGLTYQVGKFTVASGYVSVNLGDNLKVDGVLKDRLVTAKSITKLPTPWWQQRLLALRQSLKSQIYRYFPDPQASLLAGITLGQNLISYNFKQQLVATGTIHVVVVSGYNIALVGSFFLVLAPYLGRRKTTLLALVGIVCYTILVGFSAPTLRSTAMGVITLAGILLGKRTLALYLLGLTAWLMVVVNPSYLIDISFQLTFLATLGVLSFTPSFNQSFHKLHPFLREGLATTLAAQVLVVPVLFYYFGTVSLSAPLVNTLVLPVVPFVTLVGFIFLVVSFVSTFVGGVISSILMLPLTFFTFTVATFAQFKQLLITIEPNNLFLLSGYYLLVASFVLRGKARRVRKAKNLALEEANGV